jgi:hypothetical protein
MATLWRDCIYTIANRGSLAKAAEHGRPSAFAEGKQWVTGRVLHQRAVAAGAGLPVLFADASDCSRLIYWGILKEVLVDDMGTKFTVDRVRKLKGRHQPQELVLCSTGKPIAEGFIRPYAICRTPAFVIDGAV